MAEINKYIAKRIKDLRTAAKLSQTDLAKVLRVTPNTISRWEGGVYQPSLADLDRLARHFKRPIWVFLPLEREPMTREQHALLSATGDLPAEDLEELRRYADFVRTRRVLRKKT
ncbi:MAG TPA: helix-turn-helix transcriptional regulator [Planctomycetota bacterium]|jgi:transcriptional regulator with XRE-family HTH domain|nr:helix-turn-helix transcriptional regulator [Planctomycetota bacterium]